ncbi:hypothetical protein [Psychromonas sp. KJ10-2]|uniref:hypothetical protein n=1 Tax=Psychromonas sp. KJ10-2 TaxID=3391822 RepID=UPI0039B68705
MTKTLQEVGLVHLPNSTEYTLLAKRLLLWKKAEYALRRYQLFKLLSFSIITLSLTVISFNALAPQTISVFIFTSLCILLGISIACLIWVTPLTNLSLMQRNALSQKFYEEDFNIELSESKILLINRCNSQIYCQMER